MRSIAPASRSANRRCHCRRYAHRMSFSSPAKSRQLSSDDNIVTQETQDGIVATAHANDAALPRGWNALPRHQRANSSSLSTTRDFVPDAHPAPRGDVTGQRRAQFVRDMTRSFVSIRREPPS
jgi:hypothetical protein